MQEKEATTANELRKKLQGSCQEGVASTRKERRTRTPNMCGSGRATTRQNLSRSMPDWRPDWTPHKDPADDINFLLLLADYFDIND